MAANLDCQLDIHGRRKLAELSPLDWPVGISMGEFSFIIIFLNFRQDLYLFYYLSLCVDILPLHACTCSVYMPGALGRPKGGAGSSETAVTDYSYEPSWLLATM